MALRTRPEVVGGFHISFNGLLAGVLGRVIRAQSLYFCGGGPREVLGGGFYAGNNSANLRAPDLVLQKLLLKCVSELDVVIVMGNRSMHFFRENGVDTTFARIPGGIDTNTYTAGGEESRPEFDLIFVGRLVEVKRVDLLLDAVAKIKSEGFAARTVLIGTGELENSLKEKARTLGIENDVLFAGHQSNVASWLRRSRMFVLCSDSEGLSLALMEAMSCGLPSVVSDVGELGELVEHGKNGFLVKERNGGAFAAALKELLSDEAKYREFAVNAARSSCQVRIEEATKSWDYILGFKTLPQSRGRVGGETVQPAGMTVA